MNIKQIALAICVFILALFIGKGWGSMEEDKICAADKAKIKQRVDLCWTCAPQCKPPPITDGEDE